MKIRNYYKSLHALKKMSYRLIFHLHDLEQSGKKRQSVIRRQGKDGPVVVLLLKSLKVCFTNSLSHFTNDYELRIVKEYLRRLEYVDKLIEANSSSSRALKKGHISRLLTAHTRTFNTLSRMNKTASSDYESWQNAVRCAVRVWKDDI